LIAEYNCTVTLDDVIKLIYYSTASRYILVRQTVDGYSQWDRLKDIDSKTHGKLQHGCFIGL